MKQDHTEANPVSSEIVFFADAVADARCWLSDEEAQLIHCLELFLSWLDYREREVVIKCYWELHDILP